MTTWRAGVILCGGRSSRMGRPKAFLPVGDTTFLDRIARTLSEVCSPIILVAAVGQELPPVSVPVTVVRDPVPDQGPLVGLAAGLAVAAPAFVTACDAPLLTTAFVRRLSELRGDAAACVPRIDGQVYPLTAVYAGEVVPVIEAMVREGRRAVREIAERVSVRFVGADELPGLDSLRTVNTEEEYERFRDDERRG